jgi:hypothetical protein
MRTGITGFDTQAILDGIPTGHAEKLETLRTLNFSYVLLTAACSLYTLIFARYILSRSAEQAPIEKLHAKPNVECIDAWGVSHRFGFGQR